VILNIAQLIMVFSSASFLDSSYTMQYVYYYNAFAEQSLMVPNSVNAYVSCIGVVFATVWAGGTQQREEGRWQQRSNNVSTAYRSGSAPVGLTRTRDNDRAAGSGIRVATTITYDEDEVTGRVDSQLGDSIILAERKESRENWIPAQVAIGREPLRVIIP
jgi:hypothetical protein